MKKILLIFIVFVTLLTACSDPFLNTTFIVRGNTNLELSTAEYLQKDSAKFSLWIQLLKYTNLYNALNDASSTATVFAPDNDAMQQFLKWKGVDKVQDLNLEYAKDVAKVHILKGILNSNIFIQDIGDSAGVIPVKTLFGSYLTASYGYKNYDVDDKYLDQVVLQDSGSIYLNDQAKVANLGRADSTVNGRIYTLESVIHPLSETIIQTLQSLNQYKIFVEAAQKTGYDKVASVYADTVTNLDGSISITNTRFTCFAVPDSVYESLGINSAADLATYLKAGSDYQDSTNALHQYVEYHFLKQSLLKKKLGENTAAGNVNIYDTEFPGNVITVKMDSVDGLLKINNDIGIIRSDIAARNGTIYKIDNVMPVFVPAPVRVVWDFCNTPDIESFVDAYGAANGYGDLFSSPLTSKEYQVDLSDDQRDGNFGTITDFTYLATETKASTRNYRRIGYFKTSWSKMPVVDENVSEYGAHNNDLLILNLGFAGNVTMKTPTIIKGKYKVVLYYASNVSLISFYTSGSNTKFNLDDYQKSFFMWKGLPANFVDPAKRIIPIYSGLVKEVLWDEVDFSTSGSHTFKGTMMDINAKTSSLYHQLWDYLEFIPISN